MLASIKNPGPHNKKDLSVYYQNIQGLIPFSYLGIDHPILNDSKILELNHYVQNFTPDVVVLNETWLKPTILNNEILANAMYNTFRLDRSPDTHPIDKCNPNKFRKNGGGVLIAVHNQLSVTSRIIPLKCMAEMLALELIFENNTKIIIVTCYRVGTLGLENADEILKALKLLSRKNSVKKLILVGDFNLPKIDWSNGTGTSTLENIFLDGFAECGMIQCVHEATHTKNSILDLVLSKNADHIRNLKIASDSLYCFSDHYPITFDIIVSCKRRELPKRTMYNYNYADWTNMMSELSAIDWESEIDRLEPDLAWNKFKNILFEILDKHVPKFTVKTEFRSPWFDSECFQKCKEKEKLHKKFKSNRTVLNELKFRTCRKEFKNLVKAKMRTNFDDQNRNNLTKKFWSYVKSTSKSTRIPELVYLNGKTSSDSKTKADMFNEFFYNQFSEASQYDVNISFDTGSNFDIDFNVARVRDIISKLDSNKAQGPDDIHGVIFKKCSRVLAKPLSLIFTVIYNTGMLPEEWKLSNVIPVFKKGDKKDVQNYRPISLTCIAAKVMERVMYDELLCRTQHLIDDRQHGFLKNKSCATNMTTMQDSVSDNLLLDLPTDIIYFDFAKAFDTVNHYLLLSKLKFRYNIEGCMLKFFKNYLKNRRQRVVLDNCISNSVEVLSGVPQGSILGPLLFVLFINDIYDNINENSKISLYADDTKLWRRINSVLDCDILQKDIDTLYKWTMVNKLKFHADKCKVLSVANNVPLFVDVLPFSRYSYQLGSTILDYTNCERDLGILVNERFNWQDHQTYILKKASQMFGMTKRTCHFVYDRGKKRSLYLALVRSYFEHCSCVWRPVNSTDITKFESLQRRAMKWINNEEGCRYTDEFYEFRCKQTDILPLKQHFDLNDILLFHKIVYNLIPVTMPSYIYPYHGASKLRSSHLDYMSYIFSDATLTTLQRTRCNNKFFKSFFYRTVYTWNKLPLDIREISSHIKFKLETKSFLYNRLMQNNAFDVE